MNEIARDRSLDLIFRNARTHSVWLDKPVSDITLQALYELLRMGPTSANSSPARFIFVRSQEAKAKLAPHLSEGNRAKTMSAPVTAIVAYDTRFTEQLPERFNGLLVAAVPQQSQRGLANPLVGMSQPFADQVRGRRTRQIDLFLLA